jgi:hypothetical protein
MARRGESVTPDVKHPIDRALIRAAVEYAYGRWEPCEVTDAARRSFRRKLILFSARWPERAAALLANYRLTTAA